MIAIVKLSVEDFTFSRLSDVRSVPSEIGALVFWENVFDSTSFWGGNSSLITVSPERQRAEVVIGHTQMAPFFCS
jgi:hypothetical protein